MIHAYIETNDTVGEPDKETPALEISVVGDTAFISIGKYTSDYSTRTFVAESQISVSTKEILNALDLIRVY